MRFFVQHDNPAFENRIRYVFDFIAQHPLAGGKPSFFVGQNPGGEDIGIIRYLSSRAFLPGKTDFYLPARRLFFSEKGSADFMNKAGFCANSYLFEGFRLFSVEREKTPPRPFFQENEFAFDLVETLFFYISRIEEHFCSEQQKDEHGRMKPEEQFLVQQSLEKSPVADHLVYCFLLALGLEPLYLPGAHRLTYDLDIMQRFRGLPPFRSTLKYALSRPSSLFLVWQKYVLTKAGLCQDPYQNFDQLWKPLPGVRQLVYFLTGGPTKYDKPFPRLNAAFARVVLLAKERGLDIGIHPSYATWDSLETMRQEKSRLEEIAGCEIGLSRQHYLHFSMEKTPPVLEALGIQEDSSLGFPDRIGFRCGTGFPYRLYSFAEERPWQFLEAPLAAMDLALVREAQQTGFPIRQLWDDFMKTNENLSHVVFNFHNSRFFDATLDGIDLWILFEEIRHR